MHVKFILASLCSIASAAQKGPMLQPRQFLNTSSSSTTSMAAPATTFGAAAAAIQNAIAAGLAQKSAAAAAAAQSNNPITTTSQTSTSTTTAQVTSTSITTVQAPANIAPIAPIPVTVAPPAANSSPAAINMPSPTKGTTMATGATVGSQGTVTVDGNVYTTAVVASYVTVVAGPTTFYENGIAYVASYAGQTITVTDCPCTRSAQIVFATTTVCSACVDGSVTSTSSGLPTVATDASGDAVVFTGSAARGQAAGLQTLVIGGIIVVVAGLFM